MRRGDLLPAALSVRGVVEAIKKYTTSGTLCWVLARETQGRGRGDMQDSLGEFGSTQRVFAHCAKAVFAKVEVTLALTESIAPAPSDDAQRLHAWLAQHELQSMSGPLQALGVYALQDLTYAASKGLLTVERLAEVGVSTSLRAMRLLDLAIAAAAASSQ
jgi:hypothetical protein